MGGGCDVNSRENGDLRYRCPSTDRKKSKLERMCLLGRHQREVQGNCTIKAAESCDCEHAEVAPINCEQVVHLTRVVTSPRMCSIRSTQRSPDVRFCGEPWQAAQTVSGPIVRLMLANFGTGANGVQKLQRDSPPLVKDACVDTTVKITFLDDSRLHFVAGGGIGVEVGTLRSSSQRLCFPRSSSLSLRQRGFASARNRSC